jgi:hypothetical protein
MPRGRKTTLTVRITSADRQTLLAWQRSPTLPAGLVRRGRIILLVSEGKVISEIARTVGSTRRLIYKWVQRFQAQGLEGLANKQGRGHRPGQRRSPLALAPDDSPAAMAHQGSEFSRMLDGQVHPDQPEVHGPEGT